ncbi:DUF6378 domain-containing protein [Nocardia niigatensis]
MSNNIGISKDQVRAKLEEALSRFPDDEQIPVGVPGAAGEAPAVQLPPTLSTNEFRPAESAGVPRVDDAVAAKFMPTAPTAPAEPRPRPARPRSVTGILGEAATVIDGDRQDAYGDPSESFARIAGLWSAYLGADLTARDVANLMVLLKVSRSKHGYRPDDYIDIAGYAALAERISA